MQSAAMPNNPVSFNPDRRIVAPDAEGLRRAVELLRRGSVCAFPTETVYGLGAYAFSATAVAEVYRLKNRPAWNPLIVHVANVAAARALARSWPDAAAALAERFWPGPLTIVIERSDDIPPVGTAETSTIALRIPDHPVARALLEACRLPLAAPSANRSEGVSPTRPEHVVRSLPDVPLVLDGGACRYGIESTVLDVTSGRVRLLRAGALALRSIREVVGPIDIPELAEAAGEPRNTRSPGTAKRHYAPRSALVIQDAITPASLLGLRGPIGVLAYERPPGLPSRRVRHLELLPPHCREYAADLYAALHRLDDAGVSTIVAQAPPSGEEWIAVQDRLTRAAHGTCANNLARPNLSS
jgi:L-threonylcarbamoyladenylate synthase